MTDVYDMLDYLADIEELLSAELVDVQLEQQTARLKSSWLGRFSVTFLSDTGECDNVVGQEHF